MDLGDIKIFNIQLLIAELHMTLVNMYAGNWELTLVIHKTQ